MWRFWLCVLALIVGAEEEDEPPLEEAGQKGTSTVQVGSLGKLGHLIFHGSDGHSYEFSEEDKIGAGAWAKVFRARRLGNSSHLIAIKYTLFASPLMGGNEIEVLRALGQFRGQHKNMVGMAFHNAKTLKHHLESGTLSRHQLDVLCALSEWRVHEFHERTGHIHRDLKPDNILITDSLEITLIDFSLAEPILGIDSRTEMVNLMDVDVQRPCFEIRKFYNEPYRESDHTHILINGKKLPNSLKQANATYGRLLLHRDVQHQLRLTEQRSAKRKEYEEALYLD